jgi:hypothetical protein
MSFTLGYKQGRFDEREAATDLFQTGNFRLHSGEESLWKIECDSLSAQDVATLALMLGQVLPPFGSVIGVPRGGLRLAEALGRHCRYGPLLIVDDVLTTGRSMEGYHQRQPDSIGAVLFARGKCPEWITPLFKMPLGGDPQVTDQGAEARKGTVPTHKPGTGRG